MLTRLEPKTLAGSAAGKQEGVPSGAKAQKVRTDRKAV